jgi:hypothetical protein
MNGVRPSGWRSPAALERKACCEFYPTHKGLVRTASNAKAGCIHSELNAEFRMTGFNSLAGCGVFECLNP